jgi:hypothetical protein
MVVAPPRDYCEGMDRMTRVPLLVGLSVAALALAGCTSAPTLDASAASTEYTPFLDDVVSTLTAEYPEVVWTSEGAESVEPKSGHCVLWLPDRESTSSLPEAAGDWRAVMDTLNPLLQKHGFSLINDTEDLAGPGSAIASTDGAGARLLIGDLKPMAISLEIPVTDECD